MVRPDVSLQEKKPPADPISRNKQLVHLFLVATTLISLPGTAIFLISILSLHAFEITLEGNLIAPLLLLFTGLSLIAMSLTGIAAALFQRFRNGAFDSIEWVCIWLNGIALAGMMGLVAFAPQLQ